METARNMCTCGDTKCPNHPMNHSDGCTRCIVKNLKAREIPSCFFKSLNCSEAPREYSFEEFARLVGLEEKP